MVNVELLDAGECTKDWYIRFLVPVSAAFHQLFDDFLENFICTVLITDSVLSSIGADEVMAFQNSIEQVDFVHQQQTMLNNLKENMITKSIIVIEHDDLFIGNAIFINKPNLAIFRYQTENDILHHDIKREVPGVYWFLSYKYFSSLHLLFCFIDSPKLCLHPLAPSPPIMKSTKMAIVNQGTSIIYYLFF